ncbi:C4-dicarboxylate ABC transporter permease [Lampropedia cohaerens]|uniref:TRAP transporter small permease protein n=1 Tax=Lampropedia cohaerens TaxID=1610491 RepID=A0A0U1Q0B8_9BURK|nr:C4-dicarboxylate ABC transporter permease [Lampropedia cohaerens]
MRLLAFVVVSIGRLNRLVGSALVWLALASVLVCFAVVFMRHFLSTTVLWMQDLYVWLSGAMFMGVAGYALFRDDHVRVDVFYRTASLRSKALRDLIGVVCFLAPFCVVVWQYALPYVLRSWQRLEASPNVGGMPGFFVLKSFILVFVVLVALQGIAIAMRSLLVLIGRQEALPPPYRYQD